MRIDLRHVGELPANGRFNVRSNIEARCRRDLQFTGCSIEELMSMGYFDTYLRYLEQYHMTWSTSGVSASRNLRVVAFGTSIPPFIAPSYLDHYGSGLQATEFHVSVW